MVTFGTMFGSRLAGLADPRRLTADHGSRLFVGPRPEIQHRWTRMVSSDRGSIGQKVATVRRAVRDREIADFIDRVNAYNWRRMGW